MKASRSVQRVWGAVRPPPRTLRLPSHLLSSVAPAGCYAVRRNAKYSARFYANQSAVSNAAKTYKPIAAPSLAGKCKCGSVGWKASGPSAINFVCHCSRCRQASGRDALPAAGFRPEQVSWINHSDIEARKPEGSRNTRFFCKKCGDYVGEDATSPLGIIALPTHVAQGEVDDCYKPNHHIFYADRVGDAADGLPKWQTLPEGQCLAQPANTNARESTDANWRYDPTTGRFRKDVLPFAPVRGPYAKEYIFTESDPVPNHETYIAPEKVQERVAKKYYPSPGAYIAPPKNKYDVIVIGGGHNGLVSAAYLAKQGLDVLVLERRDVIGGAAITEEIVPGFKFSRASYLAGLLRPKIIEDLELEKYGFKCVTTLTVVVAIRYLVRKPSSFTPSPVNGPYGGKSLILGDDHDKDYASIAQCGICNEYINAIQFSARDADAYFEYEEFLGKIRQLVNPLLDGPPPDPFVGKAAEKRRTFAQIKDMVKVGFRNRETLVPFYELLTAPAAFILDRWFEHEMLKTTLATDAVIGAMCSPYTAGSAYVLLHHVMGSAAGREGVWAYVEGGMGAITRTIGESAKERGATIVHNATVSSILYEPNPAKGNAKVKGVKMADGTELYAKTVLSNATPYHTFLELLPGLSRDSGNALEESPLPPDFVHHIRYADYSCGAFKINCAVDKLPDFECLPNHLHGGGVGRQHRGTVHFENKMEEIDNAYREASMGMPATRPVLEMTIPTSVDTTIAPPGKHVVQLFVQFAPYDVHPKIGNWADPDFKNAFADRCFSIVDEFAPGFSSSVIGRDVLTPLDLERIFGLHKGNIMHGALSLHQLAFARPMNGYARHRTPVDGLYICGAGAHPGGGVMGAAGRNCAHIVMSDVLGK